MQVIQVEHPNIKGHMVNMTVSERTSFKHLKMSKGQRRTHSAELKELRNAEGKEPRTTLADICQRGAAKILGFVSSHIYASKPE